MTILGRPYEESYPPSLFLPRATGATAGIPGTWTPGGSTPPASLEALMAGTPNTITASPATPWTSGQFVQTATAGTTGRATWTGTAWVGGAAPLSAEPQVEAPEAQAGGGGVEYSEPEPPAEPQRRRRSRP